MTSSKPSTNRKPRGRGLVAATSRCVTARSPIEKLWNNHLRSRDAFRDAYEAEGRAIRRAEAMHPPRPKCLYYRLDGKKGLLPLTLGMIKQMGAGPFGDKQRSSTLLKTYQAWWRQCATVDAACGLPALTANVDRHFDQDTKIQKRIATTPASRPRDLAIKMQLLAETENMGGEIRFSGKSLSGRLARGLLKDLNSMA